jgi:hypothetical protein
MERGARAGARAPARHETEHAMSLLSWAGLKSGKDIRLTEYAACAG